MWYAVDENNHNGDKISYAFNIGSYIDEIAWRDDFFIPTVCTDGAIDSTRQDPCVTVLNDGTCIEKLNVSEYGLCGM